MLLSGVAGLACRTRGTQSVVVLWKGVIARTSPVRLLNGQAQEAVVERCRAGGAAWHNKLHHGDSSAGFEGLAAIIPVQLEKIEVCCAQGLSLGRGDVLTRPTIGIKSCTLRSMFIRLIIQRMGTNV